MECGQDLGLLVESRWDMHGYMIYSHDVIVRAHLNRQRATLAYHILLKENFSRSQNPKLQELKHCKLPPSADSYRSASLAALWDFLDCLVHKFFQLPTRWN